MDLQGTAILDDQSAPARLKVTRDYTETVLAVLDGQRQRVLRRYAAATESMSAFGDTMQEVLPVHGVSVTFEKSDDGARILSPEDLPDDAVEHLDFRDMFMPLLPAQPVPVGYEWELPPSAGAALFEFEENNVREGAIKARFREITEQKERQLAHIEIGFTILEEDEGLTPILVEGRGTFVVDISQHEVQEASLSGTCHVTMALAEEGHEMKIDVRGPFSMSVESIPTER
jgi:hypothetical protein